MGFVYGSGAPSTTSGGSVATDLSAMLATQLARRIASDLGESALPEAAPTARGRTLFAQVAMPANMQALNDVNLATGIIGYLDLASRAKFAQVAKCTFNASARVKQLHITKMAQLTQAQRAQRLDALLARHQFHSLDTQALLALGEGRREAEMLRASYAKRSHAEKAKPFVHWCLDRAIAQNSARPMHLALCLPETDVNAMYERATQCHYTALHTIAFHHTAASKLSFGRLRHRWWRTPKLMSICSVRNLAIEQHRFSRQCKRRIRPLWRHSPSILL